MLRRYMWWKVPGIAVGAVGIAMAVLAAGGPASAASGRAGSVTPAGPVSAAPAPGTPELDPSVQVQTVRQIVQCGTTMYAVGSITQILQSGNTFTRDNVFSFSATKPYTMKNWAPDVNGEVNTIAFSGGNCADAYIGGKFTAVNGVAAKNIAEIDTTTPTGALVTGFRHNANGQVETIAPYGTHLLVGGYYTSINNSTLDKYMTSLNAITGKDDGFLQLGISGNYQYCNTTQCTSTNPTRVYNQQISHGGTLDLVEGDFTSVGGQPRQQIFMLNLATTPASVTGWTSPEWDGSAGNIDQPGGYPYQCSFAEPFYLQAAAWSPDDQTIYIASTGYKPFNVLASQPRSGLCDAAAAFPATQASVLHYWVNYTGCDSLYSVAADDGAAYAGGHERWSSNPNGCDTAGSGAITDPGMEGLSPGRSGGTTLMNSAGTGPLYTRSRGQGADDMLVTGAGLWVASDNDKSQGCNGASAHAGICFLPYGP